MVKVGARGDDEVAVTRISVIVPAHNEERWLPSCLASIAHARSVATRQDGPCGALEVEVVVVANRCTDRTADLARAAGAVVVEDDHRTIAAVRNAGAAAATGDILVTIDADSRMDERALATVAEHLATGDVVGGSARVQPERHSLGIDATYALLRMAERLSGLGGGMYWCWASDFHAIGGFNEQQVMGEDLDFARRLREHGRVSGRRFRRLNVSVTTSCRKFDQFGDWHAFGLVRQVRDVRASLQGSDRTFADRYFYDVRS